jgi:beta-galactosidase GanA
MDEGYFDAVPARVPTPPPAPPVVRLADGLAYGGDYNPEQWPREAWDEDVRLMREAGVNLVTLGVFAWGTVEVDDGEWDWPWLDDAVELLHQSGIGVDLATPTAAPPNWLLTAHPEIAPVLADGFRVPAGGPAVTRRAVGDGAAWYVSAPLPADAADGLARQLVAEAGVPRTVVADPGVEAVRRVGDGSSYLFLLNHTEADRKVAADGRDLLTGGQVGPMVTVPAGGVRVLRERPEAHTPRDLTRRTKGTTASGAASFPTDQENPP